MLTVGGVGLGQLPGLEVPVQADRDQRGAGLAGGAEAHGADRPVVGGRDGGVQHKTGRGGGGEKSRLERGQNVIEQVRARAEAAAFSTVSQLGYTASYITTRAGQVNALITR